VTQFPNATVAEYGTYHYDVFAVQAEIFFRGPVKASVDATPLQNYTGGVMWDAPAYESDHHNHVSVMCVYVEVQYLLCLLRLALVVVVVSVFIKTHAFFLLS
jgi:hypothetical protein